MDPWLYLKYKTLDILDRIKKTKWLGGEATLLGSMTAENMQHIMESRCNYVCDDSIAMNIWMALSLQKPLLVEGPPGGGKTELAKVIAMIFDAPLIRLQCYDGIDDTKALYEWNYQKQLIDIQMGVTEDIFGEKYLLNRPILSALRSEKMPVLLIDEIDKTDDEFEANLLEVLSDFQVSIPELGTITAKRIPPVILTSNGVRELGDALRRRCVYLYLDYPTIDKEATILMRKIRGLRPKTSIQIAASMSVIRSNIKLFKQPSVSESLDLAQSMVNLREVDISAPLLDQLATIFLKNKEDLDKFYTAGGATWVLSQI